MVRNETVEKFSQGDDGKCGTLCKCCWLITSHCFIIAVHKLPDHMSSHQTNTDGCLGLNLTDKPTLFSGVALCIDYEEQYRCIFSTI